LAEFPREMGFCFCEPPLEQHQIDATESACRKGVIDVALRDARTVDNAKLAIEQTMS